MAVFLKRLIDTYRYLDYDLADPRTREYSIILNPLIIFGLLISYYQFVYNWGPRLMRHREPFNLTKIMIVYNASQILFCTYVAYRTLDLIWWPGRYSFWCQPVCYDDTPEEREINAIGRQYYLLKIYDLLDTVFFVMRKKDKQITFLHVYHHLGMVLAGMIDIKYVPVGHGLFIGTINSIVHSIMYFYYLLTCINKDYKRSVWWKKYITQLQMLQFVMIAFHFSLPIFNPYCTYPTWPCFLFVPQNVYMFVMFADFYIKTYIKKEQ